MSAGALEVLPTFTPSTKPPASSPLSSPVVRRSLLIVGGSLLGLGVVSYAGWRWWRSKKA